MAKRTDISDMYIRVPSVLKDWIARRAEEDERTQNAIVVRILRSHMDQEQREATGR